MNPERWKILEPLLNEALDLTPEERAPWFAALQSRSPDIAAELGTLLSQESAADEKGFLIMPPLASLAGLTLGDYTLERPLGEGGMGTVWLASRSDGRFSGKAAVKILSLALVNAKGMARFQQEGSALSRLAHPRIARLFDAGLSPSGQPYLVLEYVDGEEIDSYVRKHRLSTDQCLELFLQVLDAVAHAHANLIVHRDLKPSNILVTADGGVKLLDFGIAKLLDPEHSGEGSALTQEGAGVLTPRYAAPEQVRGEAVTTATDVYALGVLLYILLSGRHPTAEGAETRTEIVQALFDVEPPRLRLGDLDTILAKALEKVPDRRYQSVTELAEDVERYRDHRPVRARPTRMVYRAAKYLRRNRVAVVVALLLIAATVFSLAQLNNARQQRDAALREREVSDAQVEFQNVLLSSIGEKPVTMREVLDAARLVLSQQYANSSHTELRLLRQLASSYASMGEYSVPDTLLGRAESLAVALPAPEELAEIHCQLGDTRRNQGRYSEAWQEFAKADSLLAGEPNFNSLAFCLALRSELAQETGRSDQALVDANRARAIMDSLGRTRESLYIELIDALAQATDADGRTRESLALFQREIAALDSSGRGGMIDRDIARHNMAVSLGKLGETDSAESMLHDVLQRFMVAAEGGHLNWQPLIHYSEMALVQGHADSAFHYFDLIVHQAIQEKNLYWEGRGSFGRARAAVLLGRTQVAVHDEARLAEVIRTYRHVLDTDDIFPDDLMIAGALAYARGDTAAGVVAYSQVLERNSYFQDKFQRRLMMAALETAAGKVALHQPDEALALIERVKQTADLDSVTATRSLWIGRARYVEGAAYIAKGDTAAGRRSLQLGLNALAAGGGAAHPWASEASRALALIGPARSADSAPSATLPSPN